MRENSGAFQALALVLPLAVLALAATPVSARTPEVEVEVHQTAVKIDASIPSPMTASFSGAAHVSNNELQTADVRLELDAGGWPGTVTPSERAVTGNASVQFSALVTAPSEAAEGSYLVKVIASAEAPGSGSSVGRGLVTVRLVRNRVGLACEMPVREGAPGQRVVFALRVWNDGSTSDTFSHSVRELAAPLQRPLWLLDQDAVELAPGDFVYINVELRLPGNATPGSYTAVVYIQSSESSASFREVALTAVVRGQQAATPAPGPSPWLLIGAPLIIAGACLCAFIGGTEVGLLAFLQLVFVPLFVRIKREHVLDHFTRGQIFGFIKANPGTHYLAIQEHLEVENGVLAYHLKVLERGEYIISVRDGIYRRFYPRHMKIPTRERQLTRVQLDILDALRSNPGTSQNGLARMLGESKQVVAYHIKVLSRAGLVRVEREGQLTRCFLVRGAGERPREEGGAPPAGTPGKLPELMRDIKA
ncbi:MAG: helix-turn-helix domain-containing protein [Thermoplasmatota archaeon]